MGFAKLLFPPLCALCGGLVRGGREACRTCLDGVAWTRGPACGACGAQAPASPRAAGRCLECAGKPIEFDWAVALGAYAGRLRELVIALKQPPHRTLAGIFAAELARRLGPFNFDSIVPVPTHWFDRMIRGAGAAEDLAAGLGRRTGRPVRYGWLRKRRRTEPQKTLPLARRLGNPSGAFAARSGARGRKILLVDDVLTTGATLSACARALREAGAASVGAAVVARGQASG